MWLPLTPATKLPKMARLGGKVMRTDTQKTFSEALEALVRYLGPAAAAIPDTAQVSVPARLLKDVIAAARTRILDT